MIRQVAGVVAGAALLAGCAGGVTRIVSVQQESFYDPSLVLYAAQSGELPAEVHGKPFGGSPADVVPALRMPGWIGNAHFVPSPDGARADYYRVVLLFGETADRTDAAEACDYRQLDASLSGKAGHVRAVFCAGRTPLSSLLADGPAGKGADDPAFRQFMGQVIAVLLPSTPPRRNLGSP